MHLYNTLTRKIEDFTPQNPQNVKIYTCGPTVYSTQHIGNYAAYIYWDTLIRTLRANGYQENRVLNITDVGHLTSDADEGEDKLEKGAKREGQTVWQIAEYYTDDFLKNFHALNLIEPTKITKATDYIESDINLIKKLAEKGYTYETKDGIYYDTSKFLTYADFAHLDLKNLRAGARVEYSSEKRNPSDFALWKYIQPGEDHAMNWESPNQFSEVALPTLENHPQEGSQRVEHAPHLRGYPGWHIECSAIIHAELDETIDIHTGGIDHIPVHHTNEIAQSEAAFDKPLSNFWLHNNFLTINGEKISKSLGNIYTFEDLIAKGLTHMDFRMWVLQGHYQSERNFTLEGLTAAKQRLLNYRNFAAKRHQNPTDSQYENTTKQLLRDAFNDNLNTPKALSLLDTHIVEPKTLTAISNSKVKITNLQGSDYQPTENFIQALDNLLGLDLLASTPDITEQQKQLISDREAARTNKDYATADQIRNQLSTENLEILDTPHGPIWQYLS